MNKTSLESALGLLDNPSESVSKLGVELESIEETGVAAVEKMDSGRVPNLGGQHGHGKPGIPKKQSGYCADIKSLKWYQMWIFQICLFVIKNAKKLLFLYEQNTIWYSARKMIW